MRFVSSCIKASSSNMTSTMKSIEEIKTFIFLDTETTGLPHLELSPTKLTELCLVAVEANHIRLGVFPRVQNKLSFCFNPFKMISSGSEELTGLSNDLLVNQHIFSKETVETINSFLNHNPKPICFVAHNGNRFDYPILRREIGKSGTSLIEGITCIDSLVAFRQLHNKELTKTVEAESLDQVPLPPEFTDNYDKLLFDAFEEYEMELSQKVMEVKNRNETTPKKQIMTSTPSVSHPAKKRIISKKPNDRVSFKLVDIYTRLTKKPPIQAHHAEADVQMLITCAATLGDKFVDWANVNAKKFYDIPPMVPGKKIGL